jgi:probable F420-dependent oxidoreductase
MKFSVGLLNGVQVPALQAPLWERSLTPADQARALKLADELGFYKASASEHFVISKEHRALSGDHYPQTTTALAFMAGVTSRLKLTSAVTLVPLIHPIVQAKMWSTLDWLSGGRAILMAGVGWLKDEFDLIGVDFHQRGRLCDEYIAAMVELWTSDNPTFEGEFVKFREVGFAPKPVQGSIPLWFGGDAPGVLRRVARWGAGWSPFQTPPGELPAVMDKIKSLPEYRGQAIDLTYSMSMLRLGPEHQAREAPQSAGHTDKQKVIDQIGFMQNIGVTETDVPRPRHRDFEEYLDWLRWVGAEILPHYR